MKKKILLSPLAIVILIIVFGVGVAGAIILGGSGGGTGNVDLQKGLVGWWKMDGNTKDSTPNGNDGTGFSATGGTITYSGGYTIHTFTTGGTFTPSRSGTVEYLVVAGGGGVAADYSAGGGGGGVLTGTTAVAAQAYTITVGAGGANTGGNGENSVFSTITATGGGGGKTINSVAAAGGSGGGGPGKTSAGTNAGGAGTVGQGNNGGSGTYGAPGLNDFPTGGGGGAGAVGTNGVSGQSGNGGNGIASSISGASVTYAGGGGGGGYSQLPTLAGAGGTGGGGNGNINSGGAGNPGTVNTGGGAGGAGGGVGAGAIGGSGIVIIRYTPFTTDRKGQTNKAYSFNGTTDVVTVADSASLDITGTVSIGGWVYDPPLLSSSEKVPRAEPRGLLSKLETRNSRPTSPASELAGGRAKLEKPPLAGQRQSAKISVNQGLDKEISNQFSSLFTGAKSFLGFASKKLMNPYATKDAQERFHQELANKPVGTKKMISPYQEVTNLGNGKFQAEISILPLAKADLTPIDSSWHKEWGQWVAGKNLFASEVNGNKVHIEVGNDQPFKNIKQGDDVTFSPQLFVGGKEYLAKAGPTLLPNDPINPNYHNNTLEWDYGVAKRRLRIIEGSIQGSWVFAQNPQAEVRIKYNQSGKLALKLGGSSLAFEKGVTPLKVAVVNNDEEVVTKQQFNNLASNQYPVAIADSTIYYPDATDPSVAVDGMVERNSCDSAVWNDIWAGAGTGVSDGASAAYVMLGDNLGKWCRIYRSVFLFDTRLLSSSAVISAATLSFRGTTPTSNAYSDYVDIVSSSQATASALAASDYNYTLFGTALYSDTEIGFSSWSTSGYNDFPLNSSGISAISKAGITKYGMRGKWDRTNSAPSMATNLGYIYGFYSEQGAGYQPKLSVTYSTPIIIGKGQDAYSLEIDSSSLNVTGYISGSASSTTQITKAWHHVVMTYDGANIKLYVDGVLMTTTAKTGAIGTNSTALSMGSSMAGKLDDMRVYNRALSQVEVTAWFGEYGPGIQVSDLQKGLVGQWKMDGNAKDSTPYGNNGTLTGTTQTTDRKGQANKAYSFNGTTDFIAIPDSNNWAFGANNFTISMWVYNSSTANKSFFTQGNNNDTDMMYFDYQGAAESRFAINSGGVVQLNFTLPSIALNAWTHVVFVRAGTAAADWNVYYNTVAQTKTLTAGGYTASVGNYTETLRLGCRYSGSACWTFWNGFMDDVRVYNRALSATEITALHQSY